MEIIELKYFLAVAEVESVQRAGRNLSISPGSLSKAVGRLEAELGVKLFQRVGRNIKLSAEGQHLMIKAREIINLEESVRESILGSGTALAIKIGGSEALIAEFGIRLAIRLCERFKQMRVQFEICDRAELIARVRDRDFDLGITSFEVPGTLPCELLESVEFATYLSENHPLYEEASAGSVPVKRVLEYPFVVPSGFSMGRAAKSDSSDGWRDDIFPRKIQYETASLTTIEALILSGAALGYLPSTQSHCAMFHAIDIGDCPYSNVQAVKLFTRDKEDYSWKSMLFS